jgi:hypothetical protein
MATSQTCCHLPGKMLNSAAECADRARITFIEKIVAYSAVPESVHHRNRLTADFICRPQLVSKLILRLKCSPFLLLRHRSITGRNDAAKKERTACNVLLSIDVADSRHSGFALQMKSKTAFSGRGRKTSNILSMIELITCLVCTHHFTDFGAVARTDKNG